MIVETTLRRLELEEAEAAVGEGAAFVDLRRVEDYLDVHVPGSLALLYEFGPGLASRARDCLPLSLPLVLLEDGSSDVRHAAASLRGKGFTVLGSLPDGIGAWAKSHGAPASTEVVEGPKPPEGLILHVGDPGASSPQEATRIPIEKLWVRTHEVQGNDAVVVVAGYGIRAALAVGMLERAGIANVVFWRTPTR